MNIALAVIVDPARSRTLIGRRPQDVHLAGYWEFAGGKIEEDETALECAIREAKEETGIAVTVLEPWPPIEHEYPERSVMLHPFLCEGDPDDAHSARFVWVPIAEVGDYRFPEANAPLLARLVAEQR